MSAIMTQDYDAIIHEINDQWPQMTVLKRLRTACELFGEAEMVFTTSFGLEDQYITDQIAEAKLPIRIVTLDTGRLFEQTHLVWQQSEERFGIKITSFHPDQESLSELIKQQGSNGFRASLENRKACCQIRKVLPLKAALAGAKAWITGLRHSQSTGRKALVFAEHDDQMAVVKLNPILDLDRATLEGQILINQIPYNKLHDQGYPTIGCAPCTRAVRIGEDERAGRWWWESQIATKECGLHTKS